MVDHVLVKSFKVTASRYSDCIFKIGCKRFVHTSAMVSLAIFLLCVYSVVPYLVRKIGHAHAAMVHCAAVANSARLPLWLDQLKTLNSKAILC